MLVTSDSLQLHDHSTPGFPALYQFIKFAQTHVHWVSPFPWDGYCLLLPHRLMVTQYLSQGVRYSWGREAEIHRRKPATSNTGRAVDQAHWNWVTEDVWYRTVRTLWVVSRSLLDLGKHFVFLIKCVYVVVTLPSGILFPDLKRSVVSSTRADRLDYQATSMWKRLRKSQNVNLDSQTVTMKEKLVFQK